MSFKVAVVLLMTLMFQFSKGQENYLQGYIVQLNGDTVMGLIDYRNWERNPDKISFKSGAGIQEYTPMNIRGFMVLDEQYASAIIEKEMSPDRTSELTYDPKLILQKDTTFLQAIITGGKSLYYYQDITDKEQFYIWLDTAYQFLIHKRYILSQEGVDVISENKKYIGQLTLYLMDCPNIKSKLNAVSYTKSSLEKLFRSYYDCVNTEIKFEKKTEKLKAHFGLLAGMSVTNLIFRDAADDYLKYTDYSPSFNFSGGIFLDVVLPRNQGKWSIINELIYSAYKVEGSYGDYAHENQYSITYTEIGYSYLKLNNSLRYHIPVKKIFILANVGITNGFAPVYTNYRKKETKFYSTEYVEEGLAMNWSKNYECGFLFGTGLQFKDFSFDARYEVGTGVSLFDGRVSSTSRFYFLLGYRF